MDKTESFKKFLYNQVSLVIGIVGVAFGLFNMLQAPRTDIEVMNALNNIRDNHIHSIEENVKRIDQTNSDQYRDTSERLTKIETILNERLPAKQ
jgi:hypothetical protein